MDNRKHELKNSSTQLERHDRSTLYDVFTIQCAWDLIQSKSGKRPNPR